MKILMFLENNYESLLMDARVRKESVSLINAGHEITILLFDHNLDSKILDIEGAKINVIGLKYLPDTQKMNKRQKRIYKLASNRFIGRPLRMMEFIGFRRIRDASIALKIALIMEVDVYHANDYATLWLAACCSDINNKPFVYDSHELWSDCWLQGRIEKSVIRSVEKRLMPRARKVITVNESIANIMEKRYKIPKPVIVANFPVFKPLYDDQILRNTLNIPNEKPIVIYAGGIKNDRGIGNIFKVASKLPDVEFVIMGPGKLDDEHSNIKNIHILKPVPQKDVIKWLSSATIGIHPMLNTEPNQYYSLGNKVGDYLMAGLPIAVSNFPEMRKIAVGDELGVVFNPNETENIIKSLKELLKPEEYEKKRYNVIQVRKKYCWDIEEKKLISLYKKVELNEY